MQAFRLTHLAMAGLIGSNVISSLPVHAVEPKNSTPPCSICRSSSEHDEIIRTADWNEAHDLETFDSVCEELHLPADSLDDADTIVIDLDQLNEEPTELPLGKGMTLRIMRKSSKQISLTFGTTDHSIAHDDCIETDLAELPPRPMPEIVGDRRDEAVAHFQVQYAKLMSEGKENEAEQLASQFLADDQPATATSDIPRPLPLDLDETEQPRIEHTVGYKGASEATKLVFPKESSASWSDVSKRKISCSLTGAKVTDVAQFLRLATGMTIEVSLPQELSHSLRFRVHLSDEPMKDALTAIAQSGGIQITPTNDRIILQPIAP